VSWNQCVSLRAACTVAAQRQKASSHLLALQQRSTKKWRLGCRVLNLHCYAL
jgi:hypothetical protein